MLLEPTKINPEAGYKPAAIANLFDISSPTVYRMIKAGTLKTFKAGADLRITGRSVIDVQAGK